MEQEEMQSEINALHERLDISTEMMSSILTEMTMLHEKNTDLFQKLGQLEETSAKEADEHTRYKEKLESQLIKLESKRESLAAEKKQLTVRINSLESELKQAQSMILELQNQIDLMKNSKSWKLTEPIRKILWKAKGGL